MNVLLLSTHINTGGITSYLLTLSRGLKKRGHNVWLVSSGGSKEQEFKQLGVEVINKSIQTKSEISPKIFFALKSVQKLIEENNIEIIHAHTRVTQVMARHLQKKTNRVVVATCHGFFKSRLGRRVSPCWGDATIAISRQVYQHLIDDFNVPSDQIALIENGIDIDKYQMVDARERVGFRHQLNLGDEPMVGIISRLSDVKGIDVLIRAVPEIIKSIPVLIVMIVGQGREEEDLKNLVKELKLEEYVKFLPVVEETQKMYSLFDVFVMPSRQEGLGLAVMEAQSCGCAVVASNVGGLPSLIEDGQTGLLVEPENHKDLAEKIVTLLSDPDLGKQLGEQAREFIGQHFSSDIMVDKTVNLYLRLMV